MPIHRPDLTHLESGDILWRRRWNDVIPKLKGVPVRTLAPAQHSPIASALPSAPTAYRWAQQLMLSVERRTGLVERLARIKFDESAHADRRPRLYIGHPAIVQREGSHVWIIDATPNRAGVSMTRYEDWLHDLPGCSLWHGRARGFQLSERARIAQAAQSAIGRPYSLLNLDLSDGVAFYCSKLLWWSIRQSLGFAIDEDTIGRRYGWLMPKCTANLPCFDRLYWPGAY